MNTSPRTSRRLQLGLSLFGLCVIASWGVAYATASAAIVALAGVAGVVTFALGLSPALAKRRNSTMPAGLLLVGAAVVISAAAQTATARTVFLVVSGAVLFCAAEIADRALSQARDVERRPRADREGPVWALGVAVGSAAVSYAVISAKSLFAGGGPAALVAGTAAAVLVAFLAAVLLRTGPRADV